MIQIGAYRKPIEVSVVGMQYNLLHKITTTINLENLGRSTKSKFGAKNVYEWKYNFGIILESRDQLFEFSGGRSDTALN